MPPARKPRWERRPRRSPVLMPSVVSRGGDGSPSRVLINAGDGTFPMSITLPGGSAITGWIAAVDLDGDGDLDVLADGIAPYSKHVLDHGREAVWCVSVYVPS